MSHLINADDIVIDSSTFTGNLSITDVDVQKALDTIDGLTPTPWESSGGTIWEVDSTDEVVIGLPSPTVITDQAKLHVVSNGNTASTYGLAVEDSDRSRILELTDNGDLGIGGGAGYGGGEGVISVKDATVDPTSDPIGGMLVYASGGEFVSRSAAGEAVNIHELPVLYGYDATGAQTYAPGALNSPADIVGSTYSLTTSSKHVYRYYLWIRGYAGAADARYTVYPENNGVELTSSAYVRRFVVPGAGSAADVVWNVEVPIVGIDALQTVNWRISQISGTITTFTYVGARGYFRGYTG